MATYTIYFTAPSRGRIYAVLARFKENDAQCDPFHWPVDDEESLFAGADVSLETRAQFLRLCYRSGNVLLLADSPTLLRALPDPFQRAALAKVLTRRSVLFASLNVSPATDIEALLSYWGGAGYGKDIRPVLQAAASLPGGRQLSLAALLPPSTRALLFTFPLPGGGPQPSCHWTAFNFFADTPEPPNASEGYWLGKLKTEYRPVEGKRRYGDILLLARPDGEILHTCVYLADEIVYTKNGISHWAPWQLSTIADLLEFYSWDLPPHQALRVECHRLKRLSN